MNIKIGLLFFVLLFALPIGTYAQELHQESQGIWRARVVEIVDEGPVRVPGTDVWSHTQTLRAEILEGERQGEVVLFQNDYIRLAEGQSFFLNYFITINGDEFYSVNEPNRLWPLFLLVALFAAVILYFGGLQGVRSILSLVGSFAVIVLIYLPMIMAGYPPVATSVVIAAVILTVAIYFTHGLNREATAALVGTVITVSITGVLAYVAVYAASLTGLATDESIFLNLSTAGTLDLRGLLLGAMIIGILGVLDDIAITQASAVSEIYGSAPQLSRREVYKRALRIGREHVGALVNTLALAYAGAALPLLLLFSASEMSPLFIINKEIFATEIVRTVVGSIGLILTVPISTYLATVLLMGRPPRPAPAGHHHHHHVHH
jgi:uncharacterized membrane protein